MQRSDGKPTGPIDGSSPGTYSPPTWRGTLAMLTLTIILLGLVAVGFFWAVSQPGSPPIDVNFPLPG